MSATSPRFACDPEQPCAEHDCHEHDDARHHYLVERTDLDSPGYRPEHRVCVCGAVDVDDLPWCWCGHSRSSHGIDIGITTDGPRGCAGCATERMDIPPATEADPVHEFEVAVDGRGRRIPVVAR